jgi:adenylate cyclase
MEIRAKGIEHPITIYEVLGIGGGYRLLLPETPETFFPLHEVIPFKYEAVESSQLGDELHDGALTKLSRKGAEARVYSSLPSFTNLRIKLLGADGQELPGTIYGKVLGTIPGKSSEVSIRFTSISTEIESFFHDLIAPEPPQKDEIIEAVPTPATTADTKATVH